MFKGYGKNKLYSKNRDALVLLCAENNCLVDESWNRDEIISFILGEKERTKQKKEKIPKTLRNAIWDKYVGYDKAISSCLVCKTNDIHIRSFDCGHIIPESKGGKTNIDNLIPICKCCNSSMGTKNLTEFKDKYFGEVEEVTEAHCIAEELKRVRDKYSKSCSIVKQSTKIIIDFPSSELCDNVYEKIRKITLN